MCAMRRARRASAATLATTKHGKANERTRKGGSEADEAKPCESKRACDDESKGVVRSADVPIPAPHSTSERLAGINAYSFAFG
jgi:hypothetical protein